MQFSSQTEYTIRILLYLTCQQQQGEYLITINALSEALGINRNYLPKILKPLKEANILRSEPGSQGGFSLVVDPKTTSLLDIFAVTEGRKKINPCLDDTETCNLNREMICPVRKVYVDFQNIFDEYFGNITLTDLAEQELSIRNTTQEGNQ